MSGLLISLRALFVQYVLGLNWRLQSDPERIIYRAKIICYAIATIHYMIFKSFDAIQRLLKAGYSWFRSRSDQGEVYFRFPPIRLTSRWRDVRLLHLEPGAPGSPIVCSLITCPRITIWAWTFGFGVPAYDALSYCCGSEQPSRPILLSGKPFLVTPNLEAALSRLRLTDKARCLWIDFICIDQQSNEEKSAVVPRMGEIYANAQTVAVWLGEHTDASRLLFSALDKVDDSKAQNRHMYFMDELISGAQIHEYILTALRSVLWGPSGRVVSFRLLAAALAGGENLDSNTIELLKSFQQLLDSPGDFLSMLELVFSSTTGQALEAAVLIQLVQEVLDFPWFERAWTLQEPALARDLRLYAGDSPELPWRRFVGAVRVVFQRQWDSANRLPSKNAQALEVVEMLRHMRYTDKGPDFSFIDLLNTCRPRQATDSRDKIYAMLGLYSSWNESFKPAGIAWVDKDGLGELATNVPLYSQELSSHGMQLLSVSYDKPEEQVLLETAIYCMVPGSLRALKDCCAVAEKNPLGTNIANAFHGRYQTKSIGLDRPLPSWVTDWLMDSPTSCGSAVVDDIRDVDERYSAAKDTQSRLQLHFPQMSDEAPAAACSTAILALQGLFIGSIVEVSEGIHTWATHGQASSHAIWSEWHRIATHDPEKTPYQSETECIEALWRTLVLDATGTHTKDRASKEVDKSFREALIGTAIGGGLPPGIEVRITEKGRVYYVNHITHSTSWVHPRFHDEKRLWKGLPPGWEARLTPNQRVYYVDHNTETTTWVPPFDLAQSGEEAESEAEAGEETVVNIDQEKIAASSSDQLQDTSAISAEEHEQRFGKLKHWLDEHNARYIGRRLFRTDDGYLGMSCKHVQVGDVVAVLLGGRLPFVLRPCGKVRLTGSGTDAQYENVHSDAPDAPDAPNDTMSAKVDNDLVVQTYQLIGGECYVHGLADGQALDMAAEQGKEPRLVYIR